jgi:hypothetical protein
MPSKSTTKAHIGTVTEVNPDLYSRTDRARVWARGLTSEYDVPGVGYGESSGINTFVQTGKASKKAACEMGRLIAVIEDQVNGGTSYNKRELNNLQTRLENLDGSIADDIAEHEREIERLHKSADKRRASLEASIAQYQESVDSETEAAQNKIDRAVEVRGAILEELEKTDSE